ncbi:crotonobetainyl-CoA--carnitine CoA-transferase [Pseudoalteromonas fenneropenaei]|uniref:Crotonobetainyl-CoA--carnitine CoA-transferase n=1 Tax=Pseudoalteromonas fenneropenaei TaxID=1737459 RepID=A0ABV7CGA6_9GAMM
MKITTTLATTLGLLVSAVAFAASVNFADLDTDKNGTLSVAEASVVAALAEQFEKLDLDKDGQLTEAEFANFAE